MLYFESLLLANGSRKRAHMKSRSQSVIRESRDEVFTPPAEKSPYVSFLISADGQSITCLLCGTISGDSRDVKEKYCPKCLMFHEDRTFMLRLSEGYKAELHAESERPTWLRAA